ncbi:MAG TPA: DNA repair protein RadC [Candidatus Enterenecus merdae]|nr:DNA repair protein RadC [Candidatus Enterenecus merdae]
MGQGKQDGGGIHAGHRRRAKEEFLARGLSGLADHRVLELLLFYAIPQGDVNPLAHALVERFGGLTGVLNATYEQLREVKGIGENAACLLRLIPAVAARYMELNADVSGQMLTNWQFQELLLPLFLGARNELAYLVCMDAKSKLIACRPLGEGILDQVGVAKRKVVEIALACNASRVALAHNHVSGVAVFSSADVRTTLELRELLRQVHVELVDHFVVAAGEMISMAASGYLKGR